MVPDLAVLPLLLRLPPPPRIRNSADPAPIQAWSHNQSQIIISFGSFRFTQCSMWWTGHSTAFSLGVSGSKKKHVKTLKNTIKVYVSCLNNNLGPHSPHCRNFGAPDCLSMYLCSTESNKGGESQLESEIKTMEKTENNQRKNLLRLVTCSGSVVAWVADVGRI